MGCCESSSITINEPDHEKIIAKIFSNHPIKNKSMSYLLNLFNSCEKDIVFKDNTRSTYNNKKEGMHIKEYSEEKYNNILKFLFNFNDDINLEHQSKNAFNHRITDLNYSKSNISLIEDSEDEKEYIKQKRAVNKKKSSSKINCLNVLSEKNNNLNSFNIKINQEKRKNNLKNKLSEANSIYVIDSSNILKNLYFSMSPDFNGLFESLYTNKPKSNFILYNIAFTSDNVISKAEYLIQVLNEANLSSNLINFST